MYECEEFAEKKNIYSHKHTTDKPCVACLALEESSQVDLDRIERAASVLDDAATEVNSIINDLRNTKL